MPKSDNSCTHWSVNRWQVTAETSGSIDIRLNVSVRASVQAHVFTQHMY